MTGTWRTRTAPRGSCRRIVVGAVLALALVGALASIAAASRPAGAAGGISLPPISAPSINVPPITAPSITTIPTPGTTGSADNTPSPSATTPSGNVSGPTGNSGSISIDLGNLGGTNNGKNPNGKPNQSVVIILLLTVLAIAPALMVMLTSFTRIVIVLSLTRNALGLTAIPPNQVVIGLALFLSLFVMAPTLTKINDTSLQPLLKGKISYSQAYDKAQSPLRTFMLGQTRQSDLSLFTAREQRETRATRQGADDRRWCPRSCSPS